MTEQAGKQRNAERLAELFPTFRAGLARVIADLGTMGEWPRIQDAWRSPADQLKAFNAGHSKLKFGFHNVTGPNGEKESLAVDLLDDNSPLEMGTKQLLKPAFASERNGLATGIRWGLPANVANVIAENSRSRFVEDVRKRKRTFATGTGAVHGAQYAVKTWGLDELPV